MLRIINFSCKGRDENTLYLTMTVQNNLDFHPILDIAGKIEVSIQSSKKAVCAA